MLRRLSASLLPMDYDQFDKHLERVTGLYREMVALREGAKDGVEPSKEDLVLAELRLDDAWRETYEFMDLSHGSATTDGPE